MIKKFDVHVCLVSDQATPNYIPVLTPEFRPQEVVLVVTPRMKEKANAMAKVMHERCQVKVQQLEIINEYDTAGIAERLFELLVNVDKEKVALNATGGTKLMSIGAYSAFRDAGYPSFYVLERTGEIQILDSEELYKFEVPKIKIEDYLALHGFSILDKQISRQINLQWLPIAEELIHAYHSLSDCLSSLNFHITQTKNDELSITLSATELNENMKHLLSVLEKNQLARWENLSVHFHSLDAKKYLAGGWFEEYVFHTVKRIPDIQDCAMSAQVDINKKQKNDKGGKGRNEIDTLVMFNNTLHILECKTKNFDSNRVTNEERNEVIYKLATLKRLGGLRTKMGLVSYRKLGNRCNPMKERAEGFDISLFDNMQGLQTILSNWLGNK